MSETPENLKHMIPAWVDGVLTPVEKLAVHQQGLRHKAVSVFLISDGEILVQQRAMGKYHTPGLWANTVCTHPHWDEDSQDTCRRRLKEELGILDVDCSFKRSLEYRADVGGGLIEHEVVDLFTAQVPRDIQMALNADEVMATRWVTPADLKIEIAQSASLFTPWMKIYMDQYSDSILASD